MEKTITVTEHKPPQDAAQRILARLSRVAAYYLAGCEDILTNSDDGHLNAEERQEIADLKASMSRVKFNLQTLHHRAQDQPERFAEEYGFILDMNLTNLEILTDILDQEKEA